MTPNEADKLYELADLVHAIARQLGAPSDLQPGPCTPVEIGVMRFVGRHPGTSARAAARAVSLPSSNFSRVIKGLIAKGLLVRETDERDARGVRLYPTALAKTNTERMHAAWSHALEGTITDPAVLDAVNDALRHVESALVARPQVPVRKADR